MNPHIQPIVQESNRMLRPSCERIALNLTLHGPFSLNRRRRRECRPVIAAAAIILTLAAIAVEIFCN